MRLVIDLQAAQGHSSTRGIGRYSRELALAMAREAREHEVIIALSGAFMDTAEELSAQFSAILPRENIRVWHPPRNTAATFYGTARRPFSETLRAQFIASLQPDLVHVSSLFDGAGDDVISTSARQLVSLPIVATCYDLIPLMRHDDVFGSSELPSLHTRWYYRTLQEMTLCDGLLAISESSRNEAIQYLGYPVDRIFNIRTGISAKFSPALLSTTERAALLQRYGLHESFIMFLSADSPTKNEAGLLAAYARLPSELQARHQLFIAGQRDRNRLYQRATELGIPLKRLVYSQFVHENDLRDLYSICGLFVCPSRHEGFGLPLGEAMACGAPAIASNTTSLPEVIGREDATFDPENPDSIAACMRKVLENPAFRRELVEYGPVQAGRFTWQNSATRAWDALEIIHERRIQQGKTRVTGVLQKRLSMAYVSPLPPQASGIADYSAELLPNLARYYDITLVSEEETTERRLWGFPRLNPDEFLRQCGQFDRVLYQVGNSHFHRVQLETLLPKIPGMVVLHDAFLSDYQNWVAHECGRPDLFRVRLLHAHGYPALRYDIEHGRKATVQHYPCSLVALESAVGVIQHSQHAVDVAQRHYGSDGTCKIDVIPLLRASRQRPDRKTARKTLGLSNDEFIVCSFGGVARIKCPVMLAQGWRETGLPGRLVFAGAIEDDLRQELHDESARVYCTGRLSRYEYDLWLAAADIAVQLRTSSRGETSAAAADALMAGLPLVINRHGSAAEWPEETVFALPDDVEASMVAAALVTLYNNRQQRLRLAASGQAYARREFSPEPIALRYFESIERAYAAPGAAVIAQSMQDEIENLAHEQNGTASAARLIVRSFPSPWRGGGYKRFLVDISELARTDSGYDSQRVVREIARRALEMPPQGWRADAVRLRDGQLRHTYTQSFSLLNIPPLDLPEIPFDVRAGDVLLCADMNLAMSSAEFDELRRLRLSGLRIVLLVYDLLPLRYPQFFDDNVVKLVVEGWYGRMLGIADAAICISRFVANDVMAWLDENPNLRNQPLPIGIAHLGADFRHEFRKEERQDSLSQETLAALENMQKRPSIIMVGTVEPRKCHAQVLAAFETLWKTDENLNLIIVGKQGWKMDEFVDQLRHSPELGKRLHWLDGCSDAEVHALYKASSGLIMASCNEGFGLPIIEAFQASLPVLARDIPVFREIAGNQPRYFSEDDPQALAVVLRDWAATGFTPHPSSGAEFTWDNCYHNICKAIFEDELYATWYPGKHSTAH